MPSAKLKLDITLEFSKEEKDRLSQYIQEEVANQVYEKLLANKPRLIKAVQLKAPEMFLRSNGVTELISGSLRYDMGLEVEEAAAATNQIAGILAEEVTADVERTKSTLSCTVSLVRSGYPTILGLPVATFIQTHTKRQPYEFPWLDWLLTRGDEIVFGYRIKYKSTDKSRSGGAIMIKSNLGGWRVPPSWSSSSTDGNIIMQGLRGIEIFIQEQIVSILS